LLSKTWQSVPKKLAILSNLKKKTRNSPPPFFGHKLTIVFWKSKTLRIFLIKEDSKFGD
jgi:hypothetical protein